MKVSVAAGDERRLEAIGKTGIENPVGEYVGMLAARGQMLAEFRAALESFEGRPVCFVGLGAGVWVARRR